MSVLALIMAGGPEHRMGMLTEQRSLPFVPFGGKYRLIDFTLTNLAFAGLDRAALLVQYHIGSLKAYLEEIRIGSADGWRPVDLPLWQASKERTGCEQYMGSADALWQNRSFIAQSGSDTVLILASDQVYRLDYYALLRFHQEKGADLTFAVKNVDPQEAYHYGLMEIDADRRVRQYVEQPVQPQSTLANLAIYAVKTDFLLAQMEEDACDPASEHSIGWNLNPRMVAAGRAFAYPFDGYWTYMNGLESYWKSHLAILDESAVFEVLADQAILHSGCEGLAPAKIGAGGRVGDSIVSDGCVIDGEVVHSVLAPGVRVEAGAAVRDAVILSGTVIHAGAVVTRCVLDETVEIGAGARVGNRKEGANIAALAKGTIVPPGAEIA